VSTESTTLDRRVPYVGQVLLFTPRAGELGFISNAGCVPAQVLNVIDDDHVDVNLSLAGVNPVVRTNVPRKTERDPLGSWTFNEHDAAADKVEQLQAALRELQDQLATLRAEVVTDTGLSSQKK
jgi:hypothetical protein